MDDPIGLGADDVLAQPTRARLFALLDQLRRTASTAELADRLQLHPNGVRAHLERLEQAGLVERGRVRQARGRPLDTWAISPGARPGGRAPQGYRELGRWLARALHARRPGLPGIEATGREIGRELVQEGAAPGLPALKAALSALGFQPQLEPERDGRLTICLGNCPYRDAVHENQPAICTLHQGITAGLLERLAPEQQMANFVPRDPDRAGCTIELEPAATHAAP